MKTSVEIVLTDDLDLELQPRAMYCGQRLGATLLVSSFQDLDLGMPTQTRGNGQSPTQTAAAPVQLIVKTLDSRSFNEYIHDARNLESLTIAVATGMNSTGDGYRMAQPMSAKLGIR